MYFESCIKSAEKFVRAELPLLTGKKDRLVYMLASAWYIYLVLGEDFITPSFAIRLASMHLAESMVNVQRSVYRDCEKLGYSPLDLINKFISYRIERSGIYGYTKNKEN